LKGGIPTIDIGCEERGLSHGYWVCVIFFAKLALMFSTVHRARGGAARPPLWGLYGGYIPLSEGLGERPLRIFFFLRKYVAFFTSFFVSPRFSCPLLGVFLAHGFSYHIFLALEGFHCGQVFGLRL
jgi:hypothetical protein